MSHMQPFQSARQKEKRDWSFCSILHQRLSLVLKIDGRPQRSGSAPRNTNSLGSSVFEQANSSVQADGFASNDYAVSAANLSNFPNTEQTAQIDDSALAFTNFPPVEPGFSELNSLTYLSDLSRPAFANIYGSDPQDIPLHPLDHGIEPSRIPTVATVDLSDIA